MAIESAGAGITEHGEWQLLPIFQLSRNHSIKLDELQCGAVYELFVRQPTHGWQSERIRFRTQGKAPVAPLKSQVLRSLNGTIYVHPTAWLATESQPIAPTSSRQVGSETVIASSRLGLSSFEKESEAENVSYESNTFAPVVNLTLDIDHHSLMSDVQCPIRRLVVEYRPASSGLWKLLFAQPISPDSSPLPLPLNSDRATCSIRMTAYTVGRPYTMAEYEIRYGDISDSSAELNDGLLTTSSTSEHRLLMDGGALLSLLCSILLLLMGVLLFAYLLLLRRRQSLVRKELTEYCTGGTAARMDGNAFLSVAPKYGSAVAAAASLANRLVVEQKLLESKRPPPPSIKPPPPPTSGGGLSSSSVTSGSAMTVNANNLSAAFSATAVGSRTLASYSMNKGKPVVPSVGQIQLCVDNGGSIRMRSNLTRAAAIDLYDEITPYATFTLSPEEAQQQQKESNDETNALPEHVQQLHDLHRQLAKLQKNPITPNASSTRSNGGGRMMSISKGNSGSKPSLNVSQKGTLSKPYDRTLDMNDFRTFSVQIGEPPYTFRCMDGNQAAVLSEIGSPAPNDRNNKSGRMLQPMAAKSIGTHLFRSTIDSNQLMESDSDEGTAGGRLIDCGSSNQSSGSSVTMSLTSRSNNTSYAITSASFTLQESDAETSFLNAIPKSAFNVSGFELNASSANTSGQNTPTDAAYDQVQLDEPLEAPTLFAASTRTRLNRKSSNTEEMHQAPSYATTAHLVANATRAAFTSHLPDSTDSLAMSAKVTHRLSKAGSKGQLCDLLHSFAVPVDAKDSEPPIKSDRK